MVELKYKLRLIIPDKKVVVEIDEREISISQKIRKSEEERIPVMVLGNKEITHLIEIGYIKEWHLTKVIK